MYKIHPDDKEFMLSFKVGDILKDSYVEMFDDTIGRSLSIYSAPYYYKIIFVHPTGSYIIKVITNEQGEESDPPQPPMISYLGWMMDSKYEVIRKD